LQPELGTVAPSPRLAHTVPSFTHRLPRHDANVARESCLHSEVTAADSQGSAFSDTQYDEAYPEGIQNHFWHLARNRLVAATVRRAVPAAARVLEIGCGPAIVLRHLRASNVDCWGCDLGQPRVPAECADRAFVQQDCLQLDSEFRRSVDALLLLDVLEHIEDDVGFLRAISDGFPNSRALIVTVPARAELWSNYDRHYGHFRRYDRATLATTLAAGGFTLRHQRYFFQELYLPMLLAGRMPSQRTTTIPPPSHPGVHRLLAGISTACSSILPSGVPGTSLIALATRIGDSPA
jgi:2-polyprenyl-3-methyl-5-hydroxy-6-metoxy-1,4-benzoquinol methylase